MNACIYALKGSCALAIFIYEIFTSTTYEILLECLY